MNIELTVDQTIAVVANELKKDLLEDLESPYDDELCAATETVLEYYSTPQEFKHYLKLKEERKNG